jgi:exopolyphosphatase/guanosine-5'-triphosphate,3'-diphosphate pyrophosphatase
MRIASIDIGTNTILMLITDVSPGGVLTVHSDEQVIARLGKGVDRSGAIGWAAFERCENFLREYRDRAEEADVDVIRITGTSALRDAKNREEFTGYMREKLGLDIEVLSGEDEALWSYGGAISAFDTTGNDFAVLDIGGGSTELTLGSGFHVQHSTSLDIGCVRLTEKYLHGNPPSGEELSALSAHIDDAVQRYPGFDAAKTTVVGVAGTVTTLAAVELDLAVFQPEKVAGFRLTADMVQKRYEQFSGMTHRDLVDVLRVDPGRADIILTGVAILRSFYRHFSVSSLLVSERGLRYGIAMREWERSLERPASS